MSDALPPPLAGPLFRRRLDGSLPLAVRGAGCWIEDAAGRRYLDAVGGAYTVNLGHGVEEIARAMGEQARTLAYVSGLAFTNAAAEELAAELAEVLPPPLLHSYFLTSGSDAIEAAVKLARQVWVERGRPGKWKVISRRPSYHGNTLAALALSGRESYRRPYLPLLLDLPSVPAPDPYRDPSSPACTGEALADELERQGPETVAAFLFEPVLGSAGGAVVPDAAHYERIAALCREHDVLLIADEVLTGMGRTGRWLAIDHYAGLAPDVLVLGKGISGGYAPLSAMVATDDILDTLRRGSGNFVHAQTFSHTPVVCAAGLAALRVLKRDGLVERCAALAPRLRAALQPLAALPLVGDVRSIGLFAAVELVADRESREPLPRARRVAERVAARARDHGLLVWSNGGHVDGERGDLVLVAPPFTIAEDELDEIGARLGRAVAEMAAEEVR